MSKSKSNESLESAVAAVQAGAPAKILADAIIEAIKSEAAASAGTEADLGAAMSGAVDRHAERKTPRAAK